MTTATFAIVWLAVATSPSELGSSANGVTTLADDLTQAVVRRLGPFAGRIVRVIGDDVIVDLPGLEPGFELEWLIADADLRDVDSLEKIGTVTRPCGIVKIHTADATWSRGVGRAYPGCQPPVANQMVRVPARAIRLQLRPGNSDPPVRGLLDLLLAIMPDRLRRTGAVEPSTANDPQIAVVVVSLVARGDRIHAMLELQATHPRVLHDVIYLFAPLAPESLWRERTHDLTTATLATLPFNERVLDLAASDATLLVLTERSLLAVSFRSGSLVVETLQQFDPLPARSPIIRTPSGRVVAKGATVCFSTTKLASGWCVTDGKPNAVDGVPVARGNNIELARFVPGTTVLDGTLRDAAGHELPNIGPFLAAEPLSDGSLRVLRQDGYLERFDPLLNPVPGRRGPVGDAWLELGDDRLATSWPVVEGAPDGVTVSGDGVAERRIPCAGAVVAVERLDLDADNVSEFAIVTVAAGRSWLTIVH